ncbi:MAG: SURF1 family protein [Hyphomicrobiaceae bacterium]|nr:SURF1 family protein [Hyphomicrobiaceae bacterium]
MLDNLRGKRLIAPTVAALAALAVLVGLGSWQWQRKTWKEELIATIAARASAEPLLPERWSSLACRPLGEAGLAESCEFTTVRLIGRFDHAGERHVFTNAPRGAVPGGPGYWVLTPFDRAAGDARLYVNRGFVPEARKDPQTRPDGQVSGEIEIIGQIRTAEQRGPFTGAATPAANIWFLRHPRELLGASDASAAELARWQGKGPSGLDFYVDQISPVPPGGLPAPRASRIEIPNRHLEYALTWWGLALTLVGIFAAFVLSRRRELRGA